MSKREIKFGIQGDNFGVLAGFKVDKKDVIEKAVSGTKETVKIDEPLESSAAFTYTEKLLHEIRGGHAIVENSVPIETASNERLEEKFDKDEIFNKIKGIKEVRTAIDAVYNKVNGKEQVLKGKIKPEDFINEVVGRVVEYDEEVNENGHKANKNRNEVGLSMEVVKQKPEIYHKILEAVIKNAANTKVKEILDKNEESKTEEAEKPKIEKNDTKKESVIPIVATKVAKKSLHVEDLPLTQEKTKDMPFKGGDIVKVFNKNLGEIQDGWKVVGIKKDGKIRVELYDQPYGKKSRYFKRKTETLSKDVTLEELKKWQSDKGKPENEAPFKSGDVVKVLIGREDDNLLSNEGEMQDGWRVIGINNDGTVRVKWKGKIGLPKDVPLEDLKKWNNVEDEPVMPEK